MPMLNSRYRLDPLGLPYPADIVEHYPIISPPAALAARKLASSPTSRHQERRRLLDRLTKQDHLRASRTRRIAADEWGQFNTVAEINGRAITLMVDTGAANVLLTYEDAARLGLSLRAPEFHHVAATANGRMKVALVHLQTVKIGPIEKRHVESLVSGPGCGEHSLLGMSFLQRLKGVEFSGGTLTLKD